MQLEFRKNFPAKSTSLLNYYSFRFRISSLLKDLCCLVVSEKIAGKRINEDRVRFVLIYTYIYGSLESNQVGIPLFVFLGWKQLNEIALYKNSWWFHFYIIHIEREELVAFIDLRCFFTIDFGGDKLFFFFVTYGVKEVFALLLSWIILLLKNTHLWLFDWL